MFLLLENGEIYAPEHLGRKPVFTAAGQIISIGGKMPEFPPDSEITFRVLDASGCIVCPGFIDPHVHLIGGSGEGGFSKQTPDVPPETIEAAAITSVVGVLGVDTTMKNLPALLGRAKAMKEHGLSAFIYTGGYNVPPSTITGTLRNDIMFIEECIGAGEIAIADERSTDPNAPELARLVRDTAVAGLLSGKAGITHFHTGSKAQRLSVLRKIVEEHAIEPQCLYPTHIQRSRDLMAEAVELSRRGAMIDIDTVDEDLPRCLKMFRELAGDPSRLTVSSDADSSPPMTRFEQIGACYAQNLFPLPQLLSLVTSNVARVLKLRGKGRLVPGCDADIAVIEPGSWRLRHLIARGSVLIEDYEPAQKQQAETVSAT
ncbi:MAG TPA: amidohydrolase family protein [Planctomycetota bacterium]|nr:amidohydrolase family protein [Planctomycetota bacterium]